MKYCAFLLLLAAQVFGAESGLPDFLPPRTKVMIGVQLRHILDSSLVRTATAGTGAATALNSAALPLGAAPMAADWQKLVGLAGFDPFKDIDEVLIASTAQGQNPRVLLVARGSFNVERFSANADRYHSVPMLRTAKGSNGTIALLDASTAVLGEVEEVQRAIDRRGNGRAPAASILATASALRGRYDIWGFGAGISDLTQQSSQKGLESIDDFQFGVSVSHGIELSAEAHARTPEDAAKLMQSMQFLRMMMAQQPGAEAVKLDIHEDRGTVKLSLAISEEELKKAMEKQKQAQEKQQQAAAAKSKPAAPPPQIRQVNGGTGTVVLPGAKKP